MKDEGIAESNIVKPRIYITNTGPTAITDFYYLYNFTTENGKVPVLEDYYTPNSSVSLQNNGNGEYSVKYSFTGTTLYPGQTLSDLGGNFIGIHYTDWSFIDKSNDFSYSATSTFQLNGNIPVYDSQDCAATSGGMLA